MPLCEVRLNAGPWVPTTAGIDAVGGDVVYIRLAASSAVTTWYLQPIGTDELSATPVLTGVNPITFLAATPSTIPSFTLPAGTGRAYLFQSTVTGSGGPLVTTFAVYVLTALGDRVGAVGESREGSQDFGWITKVNPLIRNPGAPTPTVITQAGYPTPFRITSTDRRVHVGVTTTAYQVNLPSAPVAGRPISIKDKAQTASIRHITINGNGKLIDGAPDLVMTRDGQNVDLIYDGAEWAII